MNKTINIVRLRQPDEIDDPLTDVLRSGARKLLAQAMEMEADAFLAEMRDLKLGDGRDRLVRHGHGPERSIQTGIGPVPVSRVKVRDRGATDEADRVRFFLIDPVEMGASDAQSGCAASRSPPARRFDGGFSGRSGGPLGQGGAEPVTLGDHAADGTVERRIRSLAKARSFGAPLCLCVGGRDLSAGPDGRPCRMHAGSDRRHTRGQEGTCRLPDRYSRGCAKLVAKTLSMGLVTDVRR